jgi:hypothetical protein
MAIYGVGGKHGSGKTFWCVQHLVSKYFEWNKIHSEFFKKVQVEIVSNIENLKIDHYDLDEMIEKAGGESKFFTIEYQRELLKRFPKIIYIIDEASKYFPTKFSDVKVISFFQYHRHMGIDFYLIAPGISSISTGIVRLMEYRIQATPQSKRVMGEFRYRKIVEGDDVGKMVLQKDKRIFEIYRSMDMEGVEKIGSVTRKYIGMIVLMILVAFGGFYYFTQKIVGRSGEAIGHEKPSINGKAGKVKKQGNGRGVPLQEERVKGGTVGEGREVEVVFEDGVNDLNLRVEYYKAMVFKKEDGDLVLCTEDGEIIRGELIKNMMVNRELVVVGDSVYLKRKGGAHHGVSGAQRLKEEVKTKMLVPRK